MFSSQFTNLRLKKHNVMTKESTPKPKLIKDLFKPPIRLISTFPASPLNIIRYRAQKWKIWLTCSQCIRSQEQNTTFLTDILLGTGTRSAPNSCHSFPPEWPIAPSVVCLLYSTSYTWAPLGYDQDIQIGSKMEVKPRR